jgi:hypothetical protein
MIAPTSSSLLLSLPHWLLLLLLADNIPPDSQPPVPPPLPPLTFMLASMSTVPTSRSSVTPSGICTKGAERILVGSSPEPSRSARPSYGGCKRGRAARGGCE